MKILLVGIVNAYQAKRIIEEAHKRGHAVEGCYAKNLVIWAENKTFVPTLFGRDLTSYDLLCLYVSKHRWEWYVAGAFLQEKYGTVVVNSKTVRPAVSSYPALSADYWAQVKASLRFPKSAILFSPKLLAGLVKNFNFPLIVKPARGRKGRGVFLVNSEEELEKAAKTILVANPCAPAFVVREFVPNDGDIRVFTVGYKAVAAMKRTPQKGEFRSNIAQGGVGEPFDLQKYPEIKKLAEKASLVARTEFAGVDIVVHKETGEPYVLEVNSAPQFQGLEKYTRTNVALEIIKYFERLSRSRSDVSS